MLAYVFWWFLTDDRIIIESLLYFCISVSLLLICIFPDGIDSVFYLTRYMELHQNKKETRPLLRYVPNIFLISFLICWKHHAANLNNLFKGTDWKPIDKWSLTWLKCILKILHSNYLWFCIYSPGKLVAFLKKWHSF